MTTTRGQRMVEVQQQFNEMYERAITILEAFIAENRVPTREFIDALKRLLIAQKRLDGEAEAEWRSYDQQDLGRWHPVSRKTDELIDRIDKLTDHYDWT